MEIRKLSRKDYAGKKFKLVYKTSGHYAVEPAENGFLMEYSPFESEKEMTFTDEFFAEWLDDPVEYGVFDGDKLLGFAEGTLERWNNRYRISNICIFDESDRHKGYGKALIGKMLEKAKEHGARMVVLETQSCNEKAIAFYKSLGFSVIGFDLYAYSNDDPEKNEVRIDLGMKL